jgi:hypothetical protein
MGKELNAMMDQVCTVLDIIDESSIYGQLTVHYGYLTGMSGSVYYPL